MKVGESSEKEEESAYDDQQRTEGEEDEEESKYVLFDNGKQKKLKSMIPNQVKIVKHTFMRLRLPSLRAKVWNTIGDLRIIKSGKLIRNFVVCKRCKTLFQRPYFRSRRSYDITSSVRRHVDKCNPRIRIYSKFFLVNLSVSCRQ